MNSEESTSQAERGPLDEEDHDLLTFGEVAERLRIEIRDVKNQLDDARRGGDPDAIEQISTRLDALIDAASRNSASPINDSNFEKFFGYPGVARRAVDRTAREN